MNNFAVEILRYYDHFVIPFNIGVVALFSVLVYKYLRWFWKLPASDKRLIGRGLFTKHTVFAAGEVFSESLLHRRIFKVNPLLGYMHMSLAFGWFLLIVVGWVEASMYLQGSIVPLHAHVFYQYFLPASGADHGQAGRIISAVMDFLLLLVLSGVALAWFKRMRSKALGMKRTTKHTRGDRIALSALWFVFPLRLLAESSMAGIKSSGSFLTGTIGEWMVGAFGFTFTANFSTVAWWMYSIALGVFLVAMPFSRYMHIFTEIPLIFLRRYGLRSGERFKTFDHFQIEACSRCGICIDPCQLQKDAGCSDVQSVYFLRDRRYLRLDRRVVDNCLMCGRCEVKCPVSIELNTLRLNSRQQMYDTPAGNRYTYIKAQDKSEGAGKVGYFAGCMTLLTPKILKAMETVFEASGDEVWYADRDGGVCCGRPLKLSGEIAAARRMMDYNRDLFRKHGITTLVTSCPICLKVFREDYALEGVEVLHHSQYILRLMKQGRLEAVPDGHLYTYHDPCELGRGSGIYEEPREVIRAIGSLAEVDENRRDALCCGSSLANLELDDRGQAKISAALADRFAATGAETVVTACPLCKKAIARNAPSVMDISEVVAHALQPTRDKAGAGNIRSVSAFTASGEGVRGERARTCGAHTCDSSF